MSMLDEVNRIMNRCVSVQQHHLEPFNEAYSEWLREQVKKSGKIWLDVMRKNGFSTAITPNLGAKMPSSSNDIKNLARVKTLHPIVRLKAIEHLQLCDTNDIYIRVTHGERTFAEQDELYALGRTRPGKIVTNAKGGQSWHNFCLAYDVVILDWKDGKYVANWDTTDSRWDKVGELGVQAGMEWPIRIGSGNKKWIDYPHFQFRFDGLTIVEARELWNRGILHSWKGIV